jgi:hypothetical protein
MMPTIEFGALVAPGTTIDVDVVTSVQLTDEQHALAVEAKAAFIGAGLMTAEWIRRMRDLRDSLETNGSGKPPKGAKNVGRWKQVCADLFQGLDSMHANGMIRGWEALWSDSKSRPQGPQLDGTPGAAQIEAEPILRTLGASKTFYRELGKVKEAVRPVLVEQLKEGKLSCTPMAVQKAAKRVEKDLQIAAVQSVAPPIPRAARPAVNTKLPAMAPPEGGTTYSRSKWRKLPVVAERCEDYRKDVEKIRATAVAYKNAVAKLNKRLDEAQVHDRSWPSLMTMFAEFWKEEHGFDFDAELDASQTAISEAQRLYDLSMPRCHAPIRMVD